MRDQGVFERAISSRCAGPFLCGGARLFLLLYQHQPLKLKDSAAAEAKWDSTPLCFSLPRRSPLFCVSPWLFLTLFLSASLCLALTLSRFCPPGNAHSPERIKLKRAQMSLSGSENDKKQKQIRRKEAEQVKSLLLIVYHEHNSFQQVFAASQPCLKEEQWCQLLL